MGKKLGVEGERDSPWSSCGKWLRMVGLGSWKQTVGVQMGVLQSLQDNPEHSWLPREEDLPLGGVIHQWTGCLGGG